MRWMKMKMNLKHLRKQLNITQKKFSEAIEVKQASVSRWETGKSFPTIPTICKIAKTFNVNPTTVFEAVMEKCK